MTDLLVSWNALFMYVYEKSCSKVNKTTYYYVLILGGKVQSRYSDSYNKKSSSANSQ